MVAATLSQYSRYAGEQFTKGYVYAKEVGTVALQQAKVAGVKAYERAYKLVTVEVPDGTRDYYFEKAKDQLVKLSGQAKTWAIQCQTLENNKTRWKNVCHLTSFGTGSVLYHKGWWDHNLFLSVLAFPLVYTGVFKAPKMIDQYFDAQIATLRHSITGAIKDEPTVPRASVEPKKEQ